MGRDRCQSVILWLLHSNFPNSYNVYAFKIVGDKLGEDELHFDCRLDAITLTILVRTEI
jgi:hypothetical protein